MNAELRSSFTTGSPSTLPPKVDSSSTGVSFLASVAPAFFLIGAGAVAYSVPTPDYQLDPNWVRYEHTDSLRTPSLLETTRPTSIEALVIAKLDSIFERLLESQQDLDQADHRAIASNLWQMYG